MSTYQFAQVCSALFPNRYYQGGLQSRKNGTPFLFRIITVFLQRAVPVPLKIQISGIFLLPLLIERPKYLPKIKISEFERRDFSKSTQQTEEMKILLNQKFTRSVGFHLSMRTGDF
jgi:hypothetical protein